MDIIVVIKINIIVNIFIIFIIIMIIKVIIIITCGPLLLLLCRGHSSPLNFESTCARFILNVIIILVIIIIVIINTVVIIIIIITAIIVIIIVSALGCLSQPWDWGPQEPAGFLFGNKLRAFNSRFQTIGLIFFIENWLIYWLIDWFKFHIAIFLSSRRDVFLLEYWLKTYFWNRAMNMT